MARKKKKKEPRRHFGTIITIEEGKKYGLRWTDDTPTGRGKPYETFYGTEYGAKARMSEIEVEVKSRRGGRKAPVVPTFAVAYEKWYIPACEKRIAAGKLKERTLDQYRKAYARAIGNRWGHVPVTKIRTQDVEDWLMGHTRSVGEQYKSVMKKTLDECVKRNVIDRNPLSVAMVESSLGGTRDKGIWTLEQLDELAWRSRGKPFFHSVLLMAFGSCRPGESLGPMLSEIRERECMGMRFAEVDVIRQVTRSGVLSSDDDLKNGFSKRKVYVPEPWCHPVLHANASAGEHEVYLTDSGAGEHVRQTRVSDGFRRSFERGEMGDLEYHPWKNLRPSWQTWMNWRNHVEREKIEKLMGHVGRGVTAVYYDRPLDVQLMEEIAASFANFPYDSPYPWRDEFPGT